MVFTSFLPCSHPHPKDQMKKTCLWVLGVNMAIDIYSVPFCFQSAVTLHFNLVCTAIEAEQYAYPCFKNRKTLRSEKMTIIEMIDGFFNPRRLARISVSFLRDQSQSPCTSSISLFVLSVGHVYHVVCSFWVFISKISHLSNHTSIICISFPQFFIFPVLAPFLVFISPSCTSPFSW